MCTEHLQWADLNTKTRLKPWLGKEGEGMVCLDWGRALVYMFQMPGETGSWGSMSNEETRALTKSDVSRLIIMPPLYSTELRPKKLTFTSVSKALKRGMLVVEVKCNRLLLSGPLSELQHFGLRTKLLRKLRVVSCAQ